VPDVDGSSAFRYGKAQSEARLRGEIARPTLE